MSYPTHKHVIDLSKAAVGDLYAVAAGTRFRFIEGDWRTAKLECVSGPQVSHHFPVGHSGTWFSDGTKAIKHLYTEVELEALRIVRRVRT